MCWVYLAKGWDLGCDTLGHYSYITQLTHYSNINITATLVDITIKD